MVVMRFFPSPAGTQAVTPAKLVGAVKERFSVFLVVLDTQIADAYWDCPRELRILGQSQLLEFPHASKA